jgi:hypothetical protein
VAPEIQHPRRFRGNNTIHEPSIEYRDVKNTSVHKDVKRQRISVVPRTQGALMSKEILQNSVLRTIDQA